MDEIWKMCKVGVVWVVNWILNIPIAAWVIVVLVYWLVRLLWR